MRRLKQKELKDGPASLFQENTAFQLRETLRCTVRSVNAGNHLKHEQEGSTNPEAKVILKSPAQDLQQRVVVDQTATERKERSGGVWKEERLQKTEIRKRKNRARTRMIKNRGIGNTSIKAIAPGEGGNKSESSDRPMSRGYREQREKNQEESDAKGRPTMQP